MLGFAQYIGRSNFRYFCDSTPKSHTIISCCNWILPASPQSPHQWPCLSTQAQQIWSPQSSFCPWTGLLWLIFFFRLSNSYPQACDWTCNWKSHPENKCLVCIHNPARSFIGLLKACLGSCLITNTVTSFMLQILKKMSFKWLCFEGALLILFEHYGIHEYGSRGGTLVAQHKWIVSLFCQLWSFLPGTTDSEKFICIWIL